MREYKSDKFYRELLNQEGIIKYENIGNPIKIQGDTTIIYCYGNNKIYECLIDTKDLKKVAINRRWNAHIRKNTRLVRIGIGTNHFIYHYILNRFDSKDGLIVDHINRNTLDNRRCNLRVVKTGINMLNKKKYKNTILEKYIFKDKKNKYLLKFSRTFENYNLAIEAKNEIEKILDKYSHMDIELQS
jgi:hypothetical protein